MKKLAATPGVLILVAVLVVPVLAHREAAADGRQALAGEVITGEIIAGLVAVGISRHLKCH